MIDHNATTSTTGEAAPVTAATLLAGLAQLRALRQAEETHAQQVVREVWGMEADGATALALVESYRVWLATQPARQGAQ